MFREEARMQAALVFGPMLLGLIVAIVAPRMMKGETSLSNLGECLTELRATRQPTFTSPCALATVDDLVGVGRAQILGVLGEPTWCGESIAQLQFEGCSSRPVWGYAFYRLQGPGGGPELVLHFADAHVAKAEWLHTQ